MRSRFVWWGVDEVNDRQFLLAAKVFFATQAFAGVLWWILVFASPPVRTATLGTWNPTVLVGPDLLLFVGASGAAALTGRWRFGLVVSLWSVVMLVGLIVQGSTGEPPGWGVVAMFGACFGSVLGTLVLWKKRFPSELFLVGPLRFQEASQRTLLQQLLRSLRYTLVFWFTFLVAAPFILVVSENWLGIQMAFLATATMLTPIGLILLVAGSALGLWSCFTMALTGDGTPLPYDTARKLVISGPYRWVRNPMAVAGVTQTIGIGFILGSWTVLIGAAVGGALWHAIVRPPEEKDLLVRFGVDYEDYCAQVRCWVPKLSKLHRSSKQQN